MKKLHDLVAQGKLNNAQDWLEAKAEIQRFGRGHAANFLKTSSFLQDYVSDAMKQEVAQMSGGKASGSELEFVKKFIELNGGTPDTSLNLQIKNVLWLIELYLGMHIIV